MNILSRLYAYIRWVSGETIGTSISDVYNDLSKDNAYETLIKYDRRKSELRHLLSQIPDTYTRVLDLACGTGVFIDALPNKKNMKITGVDLTPGMLAIAKKRFAGRKNISFIQSDFTNVKFPDNSFDLITLANALRFVPKNKEAVFVQHLSRWLKKRGALLIVETDPLHIPFDIWTRHLFRHRPNIALFKTQHILRIMQPKFTLKQIYVSPWRFGLFQFAQTKGYYFTKRAASLPSREFPANSAVPRFHLLLTYK